MKRVCRVICIAGTLCFAFVLIRCTEPPAAPEEKDITGKISGTVTDTSGSALSGVSVTTDKEGYTSTSDSLGNYIIPNVKEGTYSLTFTKADYSDTTTATISISKAEQVHDIDMVMRYNPRLGAVSGFVVDSATGNPLSSVPILLSPVGLSGNSDSNGRYLMTEVPLGTYEISAFSTYSSNTITGVTVSAEETTSVADTLWAKLTVESLVERDIYGNLTGDLSRIHRITATVTGDSIPGDNPLVTQLTWLPVSQKYTGFVYVPEEGTVWQAQIMVYDSVGHLTGYGSMLFDKGVGDIAMPAFGAENNMPIAVLSANKKSVRTDSSFVISLDSTKPGTMTIPITKYELSIGSYDSFFIYHDADTTLIASSQENDSFPIVLKVTDSIGNFCLDTIKIKFYRDWELVGNRGFSQWWIAEPKLAFSRDGVLHLVYVYNSNSTGNIGCMKYKDGDWTNIGSIADHYSSHPYIVIDSSNSPIISYRANSNNSKITVMKYANNQWSPLGQYGISEGEGGVPSMAIDGTDQIYVAFRDDHNNTKTTVMTYRLGLWQLVGDKAFSMGEINREPIILLNKSDIPYVAYVDYFQNGRMTIKKFIENVWETIGNEGVGSSDGDYSFAIDDSDGLYIIKNGQLWKFNNSIWVAIGEPIDACYSPSIAFNFDNVLHVAYWALNDTIYQHKIVVKKLVNLKWQNVGLGAVSEGDAYQPHLIFDSNGTPFVAYCDSDVDRKATVKYLK